jgi:hypothetical protein
MYRFQYDGRLQRSLETGACAVILTNDTLLIWTLAVMLMESFDRVSRKEKYAWDVSDIPYSFQSLQAQMRMLRCCRCQDMYVYEISDKSIRTH